MKHTARMDILRANDPAAQAPPALDARAEADLRRIVSTPVAQPTRTVRRPKRRLAVAVATGGVLVAGAAVAVPMIGGEQTSSPAYAVTDAGDGKITVTIYRAEDAEGLVNRLAQAGLRAEVVYYPRGMRCERSPRGVGFDGQWVRTDNWDGQQSHGHSYTLRPADFKDATLLVEATDFDAPPSGNRWISGERMGFVRTGTFGPCVLRPAGPR